MLALLTEDSTWSMPAMPTWFRGHHAIAAFLAQAPFRLQWRHRPARANGQLALGCIAWDEAAGAFRAYALDVLELRGDRIATIVSFIGGDRSPAFRAAAGNLRLSDASARRARSTPSHAKR